MDPTLLQLVMAALSQMAPIGGLSTLSPAQPFQPIRPAAVVRRSPVNRAQVATLATATCLMRQGLMPRHEAVRLVEAQGRRQGWPQGWGRRVPLNTLDRLIAGSGGCSRIVAQLDGLTGRPGWETDRPAAPRGRGNGWGSRSQQEGFGLAPYR
ncbi:hypothetical protein EVJ50_05815 [Synechococcus sp. RSCCF101]|uniref:hypothetical protein n=1 Tax=Synechococcus sp. RSCCF101 TaxID=2511069 RepID=UPI0012493C7C|nr:hypothetical protein [Synechococcus sp. RSCCF101]QEY31830.1 hypothetical protein EVJ50_05815 [Synechococcus sp. RSCCF101]